MKLKVRKIDAHAKLPAYNHAGDAGMDLFSLEEVTIGPGVKVSIRTGISIEIPEGYAGLVWDKSGIAIREGLKTLGGVIDAGYRGEVLIGMINLSDAAYVFKAGHKIAQLLIQKVEQCDIIEVGELSDTPRGDKGFGSSGK